MKKKKVKRPCPKCGNDLIVIDLYVPHIPSQPYVWYGNSLGCKKCFNLWTATELFDMLPKKCEKY